MVIYMILTEFNCALEMHKQMIQTLRKSLMAALTSKLQCKPFSEETFIVKELVLLILRF